MDSPDVELVFCVASEVTQCCPKARIIFLFTKVWTGYILVGLDIGKVT